MSAADLKPKVWFSLSEACEYLSMGRSTIERRLVSYANTPPPVGKFRYRRINWDTEQEPIRVLASDVYAALPLPEVVA